MTGISNIPLYGVDRQYSTIKEEILDVTNQVYSSGKHLDGQYTNSFELSIAQLTNRKYTGISVNSGTQALIFALTAIKEKYPTKNKIILPTVSFVATKNAVILAGFTPYYCDVNAQTGILDLDNIDTSTYEDVAAVLYVNLLGNVIDYDKLLFQTKFLSDYSIPIIEDAAQSFGAFYKSIPSGNLGTISCLSFDPTKNLNNYGSGGMVLTNDWDIVNTVRDLKNHGKFSNYYHTGSNSKMSETDCAQMLIKLKYFDSWQQRRLEIAKYYTDQLQNYYNIIPISNDVIPAYSKYVIQLKNSVTSFERVKIIDFLKSKGIESRATYENMLCGNGLHYNSTFPAGYEFTQSSISLPIYPELTDSEVEYIVETLINI